MAVKPLLLSIKEKAKSKNSCTAIHSDMICTALVGNKDEQTTNLPRYIDLFTGCSNASTSSSSFNLYSSLSKTHNLPTRTNALAFNGSTLVRPKHHQLMVVVDACDARTHATVMGHHPNDPLLVHEGQRAWLEEAGRNGLYMGLNSSVFLYSMKDPVRKKVV